MTAGKIWPSPLDRPLFSSMPTFLEGVFGVTRRSCQLEQAPTPATWPTAYCSQPLSLWRWLSCRWPMSIHNHITTNTKSLITAASSTSLLQSALSTLEGGRQTRTTDHIHATTAHIPTDDDMHHYFPFSCSLILYILFQGGDTFGARFGEPYLIFVW